MRGRPPVVIQVDDNGNHGYMMMRRMHVNDEDAERMIIVPK